MTILRDDQYRPFHVQQPNTYAHIGTYEFCNADISYQKEHLYCSHE